MKLSFISILVSGLSLVSCEINDQSPYSDVFPEQMWGIIGRWQIENISGGYLGWSYEQNFDFWVIKKDGHFSFIDNSSELASGIIELVTYDERYLLLSFNLDSV